MVTFAPRKTLIFWSRPTLRIKGEPGRRWRSCQTRRFEKGDEDFRDYIVVRVSDEILVDIMTAACGVEYEEASLGIEWAHFEGVAIPFATPELLLRLKQTYRESDVADRIFLHRRIAERTAKPS